MSDSIIQQTKIIEVFDWQHYSDEHHQRLNHILSPYFDARSRGLKQPVTDFLFEYYSFRPGKLQRWSPGFGVRVSSDWNPPDKSWKLSDGFWELTPGDFPEKRKSSLEWVIELQKAILARPPVFGCFGLHEWAMVYKSDEVRHEQLPLRMKPADIADFVDSQNVACSHFDAFRFFTEEALVLNKLRPTAEKRLEMEQGGCIHANMDLYKWAYKFYPWVSTELIADAFLLAHKTRFIDMQASPYDLSDYGLTPITIETEDGRKEYIRKQKEIARKAEELRQELLKTLKALREWAN